MGRPRRFASNAERMRHLREQERLAGDERTEPPAPLDVAGLSEQEYVARELAVTARLYPDDPARLARSERYLRWRFQGVLRSEVAQL